MVLTRIDPTSLAKIYAAVYGVIGLLIGLPAGCIALLGIGGENAGMGAGLGLFAIIAYPLFLAIAGLIGGFVTAFVYNFVADRIGGVELEFDGGYAADDIL